MATVKVIVLVPGQYLGEHLNLLPEAAEGDEIAVFAGPYCQKLLDNKLVKMLVGNTDAVGELIPTPSLAPPEPETAEAFPPEEDPVGSLMEVDGIGQKTAVNIVETGIKSKAAFVNADPVELSERLSLSVARIQKWQAAAAQLLEKEE